MPSKSFTSSSAATIDAINVTNHLFGLTSRLLCRIAQYRCGLRARTWRRDGQAALDAASAAGPGAVIQLKKGVFRVWRPLVGVNLDVTIRGAGVGQTQILANGAVNPVDAGGPFQLLPPGEAEALRLFTCRICCCFLSLMWTGPVLRSVPAVPSGSPCGASPSGRTASPNRIPTSARMGSPNGFYRWPGSRAIAPTGPTPGSKRHWTARLESSSPSSWGRRPCLDLSASSSQSTRHC
jgi:hypothetical protein